MTAEEFRQNRTAVRRFLRVVQALTVAVFVVAFGGYAVAAWIWFNGGRWSGLFLVIAAYLLFRYHDRLVLALARRRFSAEPSAGPVLVLLNRDLETHGPQDVLANLRSLAREDRN